MIEILALEQLVPEIYREVSGPAVITHGLLLEEGCLMRLLAKFGSTQRWRRLVDKFGTFQRWRRLMDKSGTTQRWRHLVAKLETMQRWPRLVAKYGTMRGWRHLVAKYGTTQRSDLKHHSALGVSYLRFMGQQSVTQKLQKF